MNIQVEVQQSETFSQVTGGTVLRVQSKYHGDEDIYVMCVYDQKTGCWILANVDTGHSWHSVPQEEEGDEEGMVKRKRRLQEAVRRIHASEKYKLSVCKTELKVTVYE